MRPGDPISVQALNELIEAAAAALEASYPFTSAWEFDSFDMSVDGEEIAGRLERALAAFGRTIQRG